jgi:hypothetical protein
MKLFKIHETSNSVSMGENWIDHWKKFSGQPLSNCCAVLDCVLSPEVGAFVMRVGSEDDARYIVPLCETHSKQSGKSLYLSESVKLVSSQCGQVLRDGNL